MLDRFSKNSQQIFLQESRKVAQEFGSPQVETEHVLLAILRNEECIASKILRKAVKPEKIEEEAAQLKFQVPVSPDKLEEIPFSDEVKDLVTRSDEESSRDGAQTIGTEHVLLAMATQIPNGRAFKILKEAGANYGQLYDVLDEIYPKKPVQPDPADRKTVKVNRTVGFVFFSPELTDKEIEVKLYTIMQIKGVELARPYRDDPQGLASTALTGEGP